MNDYCRQFRFSPNGINFLTNWPGPGTRMGGITESTSKSRESEGNEDQNEDRDEDQNEDRDEDQNEDRDED